MDIIWEVWGSFVGLIADSLIYLHGVTGNYGWAIIVFTFAAKLVLLPLTWKQLQSAKAMQRLQPELAELRKKHGKDREKFAQEQMRLYREQGINPAAGCLPLLVQMPIWFALYRALIELSQKDEFNQPFLFIPNLGTVPTHYDWWAWVLAIITGASQWVVTRMTMTRTTDPQQQTMNQAMNFMPLMFAFISFSVPAGLVLYWAVSNLFTLIQQYALNGWGSLFPEAWGMGNRGLWPGTAAAVATNGRPAPLTNGSSQPLLTDADRKTQREEAREARREEARAARVERAKRDSAQDGDEKLPRGKLIGDSGIRTYVLGADDVESDDESGGGEPGPRRPRGAKKRKKSGR